MIDRSLRRLHFVHTMIGSFGAEVSMPAAAYDTIIMVNTIEHCKNAITILENIWNSLRPGGDLIFGEESTSVQVVGTNLCHPLRITFKFYQKWLEESFKDSIKLIIVTGMAMA